MKKKLLLALLCLMSTLVSQAQTKFELDGATIPRTIEVQKRLYNLTVMVQDLKHGLMFMFRLYTLLNYPKMLLS